MSYVRNMRINLDEFKSLVAYEGKANSFTRKDAKSIAEKYHVCIPVGALDNKYSVKRGEFSYYKDDIFDVVEVGAIVSRGDMNTPQALPVTAPAVEYEPVVNEVKRAVVSTVTEDEVSNDTPSGGFKTPMYEAGHFVPKSSKFYVKAGDLHDDLLDVLKSGIFFPAYVTGLSGNGKTFTINQVGADANREVIRVNITSSTDEDDLIGGFRLRDGSTVWEDGPVIMAMKRGAVLLLDEIDLGTDKIMCLQGVLEGNPIHIKKINSKVYPEAGFTVVATGNTKGKGDETGVMAGARILNEALLDRFAITFEQVYPSPEVEMEILKKAYKNLTNTAPSKDDVHFMDRITKMAELVRKRYEAEELVDVISTRRLVDMIKSFIIFGKNRMKTVEYGTARFEDKKAIRDVYVTLDEKSEMVGDAIAPEPTESNMSAW